MIAASFSSRQSWSPVPGCGAGGVLAIVGAITIRQLWLARLRAPQWLAVSGIAAITVLLLLSRIFPIVDASSEPPSLLQRTWYPTTLGLVSVFTLLLPAVARASLRRSA